MDCDPDLEVSLSNLYQKYVVDNYEDPETLATLSVREYCARRKLKEAAANWDSLKGDFMSLVLCSKGDEFEARLVEEKIENPHEYWDKVDLGADMGWSLEEQGRFGIDFSKTRFYKQSFCPEVQNLFSFVPEKQGTSQPDLRTRRESRIADLMCRWWYCLPPWPPEADYDQMMRDFGYKVLESMDDAYGQSVGSLQCYQIQGFPGVYRSNKAEMIDIRPHDSCPSFNNLVQKPMAAILELLVTALDKQMAELTAHAYIEGKEYQTKHAYLSRKCEIYREELEAERLRAT